MAQEAKDSITTLIEKAKPYTQESSPKGAVPFIGFLRKTEGSPENLILVPQQPAGMREVAIEVRTSDILKHEVIKEISEDDKLVRLFVAETAVVKLICQAQAGSVSSGSMSRAGRVPFRSTFTLKDDGGEISKALEDKLSPDDVKDPLADQVGTKVAEDKYIADHPRKFKIEDEKLPIDDKIGIEKPTYSDKSPLDNKYLTDQRAAAIQAPFVLANPHVAPKAAGYDKPWTDVVRRV
jgi:hypothetical protein